MSELVLSGHLIEKYQAMFDLTKEDCRTRIFEYNEGPIVFTDDFQLPYDDFTFDFALSAHYLFVDLSVNNSDSHLHVIRELARIAKEVRIFPLINQWGDTSPLLGPVLLGLQQSNYGVEVRTVSSTGVPKDNAMLRVWAQVCELE